MSKRKNGTNRAAAALGLNPYGWGNGGNVGHSVFPGRFGRRIVHVIIPGPQG